MNIAVDENCNVKNKEILVNNNGVLNETQQLELAIDEAKKAFGFFLTNKFSDAYEICDNPKGTAVYSVFTKAIIKSVIGFTTLEENLLRDAKDEIKLAINHLQTKRKANSITENLSSFFFKPNYDDYTEEQLHVESLISSLTFVSACLSIFSEQTFVALVKAAFKLRSFYQGFKFCEETLYNKKRWSSEIIHREFRASVTMAMGFTNLLASHLPHKILKLISFLGYPSDRNVGLKLIKDCLALNDRLHKTFTACLTSLYHVYLEPIFGIFDENLNEIEAVIDDLVADYPNGSIPLIYKGRIRQLLGAVEEAIQFYEKSIESQDFIKSLHNICYWDIIWSHAVLGNWKEAAKFGKILMKQCNWSPATNCYQYASFTALYAQQNNEMEKYKDEIMNAMRDVPKLRIKFGGKSLPQEKFAATKAEKYILDDGNLALPAIELFHVWNIFSICQGQEKYLKPILNIIEHDLNKFEKYLDDDDDDEKPLDNYILCLLLKGVCLRHLNNLNESVTILKKANELKSRIKENAYLLPNILCELGLTYTKLEKYEEAHLYLQAAKDDHTQYLMEAMVHLRAHNGTRFIKDKLAKKAIEEKRAKLTKRSFSLLN